MMNVAIFASGNGSNFQALVEANLNCNICLLICDNKYAPVIKRAKELNISAFSFDPKDYAFKKEYEEVIISKLESYNIDLILLAGYMRILSEYLIDKYSRKIINIHPSHLPKYRGCDAIKQAINAGEKEIGVTIHYVDYGVDTGEIIACEILQIDNTLPLQEIEKQVHRLEHTLYPRIIQEVIL